MTAKRLVTAVALALAVLLAGCGTDEPRVSSAVPLTAAPGARIVFVVLGGDETDDGPGGGEPGAPWEQLIFAGLPTSSVLADLADRRPTARTVLRDQLPRARALRPTVAAVWVGAADADEGTAEADFEQTVREIVDELRRAGARHVLLLSRTPAAGADPAGDVRYAPVLARVAGDAGTRLIALPAERPSQAAVAAAVRPHVTA